MRVTPREMQHEKCGKAIHVVKADDADQDERNVVVFELSSREASCGSLRE